MNRNSIAKEIVRELRGGNSPTARQALKALRRAEKHVAIAAEILQGFTMAEDNAWRECEHVADFLRTRILMCEERVELGIK